MGHHSPPSTAYACVKEVVNENTTTYMPLTTQEINAWEAWSTRDQLVWWEWINMPLDWQLNDVIRVMTWVGQHSRTELHTNDVLVFGKIVLCLGQAPVCSSNVKYDLPISEPFRNKATPISVPTQRARMNGLLLPHRRVQRSLAEPIRGVNMRPRTGLRNHVRLWYCSGRPAHTETD